MVGNSVSNRKYFNSNIWSNVSVEVRKIIIIKHKKPNFYSDSMVLTYVNKIGTNFFYCPETINYLILYSLKFSKLLMLLTLPHDALIIKP